MFLLLLFGCACVVGEAPEHTYRVVNVHDTVGEVSPTNLQKMVSIFVDGHETYQMMTDEAPVPMIRHGQKYMCYFPDEGRRVLNVTKEEVTAKCWKAIYQQFGTTCITNRAPEWTWDLCLGRHVRQYHGDMNFIAGYPEQQSEQPEDDHYPVTAPDYNRKEKAPLRVWYGGGTPCEPSEEEKVKYGTFKWIPKHRKIEVMFECGEDTGQFSIDELGLCQYEMRYFTPLACVEKAYQLANMQSIACFEDN